MCGLLNCSKFLNLLVLGAALLAPGAAFAGEFKVLHSFCGPKDGCDPEGGLVADQAGTLYGTTFAGGVTDDGTAFALGRNDRGKLHYSRIFTFCKRRSCSGDEGPAGDLIIDTHGNLYGYADLQGNRPGSIIELSPPADGGAKWTKKVLYSFCSKLNCTDGSRPIGGLTYMGAASGALYDGTSPLYGVTGEGGNSTFSGVAFELIPNNGRWTEAVFYDFCSQGGSKCSDGKYPAGRVTLDGSGNLFGVTANGGNAFQTMGAGVAFKLSQSGGSWTETVLYSFCANANCTDGAEPVGTLALDADQNLFGVTMAGGTCHADQISGCGTLYRLSLGTPSPLETVLYAFCQKRDCKDGRVPQAGPILGPDGSLYGTTAGGGGNDIDYYGVGGGVVYRLMGSEMSILHSFCADANCGDGYFPDAPLIGDAAVALYGTTKFGGPFGSDLRGGVLFRQGA